MVRLLPLLVGLVLILYPALVYFGLSHWGSRPLALALLIGAALRWWVGRRVGRQTQDLWLVAAAAAIAVLTLVTGSVSALKAYPVLINFIMLCLFAYSLQRGPSVIERLARLKEPDLPPSGVAYTRQVTRVWCGFFALNGTIAAATLVASDELWALYNGLIAYVLMGLLLAGEYWIRRRKQQAQPVITALAIDD